MVNGDSIVRITGILDALSIAHSSWYHKPLPPSQRKRPGPAAKPIDEQIVRVVILTAELYPWYGYKKIAVICRRAGYKVKNRHAYRVMNEYGLLHRRRRSSVEIYQAAKLYELLPKGFTERSRKRKSTGVCMIIRHTGEFAWKNFAFVITRLGRTGH